MKKLTLMFVALAMAATVAAAQSQSPNPTDQQSALERAQQAAEARAAVMRQRLNEVTRAFNAKTRFEQATGAKLDSFNSIELTSAGEVHATGNVTLTFDGGVITARDVLVGSDGTLRVGNSQVTISRNR